MDGQKKTRFTDEQIIQMIKEQGEVFEKWTERPTQGSPS